MIPDFDESGRLPLGIHEATWPEFCARFGMNSHRAWLIEGLYRALLSLKAAGCIAVYVDGSFVSKKDLPGDFDLCWDTNGVDATLVDPVLLTFADGRRAMKGKYLGDLFPAGAREGTSGRTFLDFFQVDKETGDAKGIVFIDLRGLT